MCLNKLIHDWSWSTKKPIYLWFNIVFFKNLHFSLKLPSQLLTFKLVIFHPKQIHNNSLFLSFFSLENRCKLIQLHMDLFHTYLLKYWILISMIYDRFNLFNISWREMSYSIYSHGQKKVTPPKSDDFTMLFHE